MTGMELNKIAGAILGAGLIAMLCGFAAEKLVEPKELEHNAYAVATAESAAPVAAAQAPAGPEPIAPLLAAANVEAGQKVAKACTACHSFDKGGPAKVGPNLYGIVNRPRASMAGFSYSGDMTKMGGSWSYDDLNHFLYQPKSFVAGTKMTFAGIKKTAERAELIAWLRTLADTPAPLP
ncbi:MAG: c-type cytochrome [Azospirillum sp.]|nr:c-type cytochrome [Azospirillum sp.]